MDNLQAADKKKYQTHGLVFDGGAGDAQVQLSILLNAGVNEGLDRAFVLKQQECISWKGLAQAHIVEQADDAEESPVMAETLCPTGLAHLSVESKTCSLPCGASQQTSDQSGGNWQ